MPVVPSNTVSDPATVRRPQINYAEPHTAEAMGAITSALGRRANAIGNLGDLAGQSARQTEAMGRIQMNALDAKHKSNMAMIEGVGKLGENLMNFGFKMDEVMDRRARDEARRAATSFTSAADGVVFGRADPVTGQRVSGTVEAPYSPGNTDSDPDGPSLSTERALKSLLENKNSEWAKLSPRAKQYFDEMVANTHQEYMRRAYAEEGKQIQAFRQMQEKQAVETFMNHASAIGTGTDTTSTQNWIQTVHDGIEQIIDGQVGQYRDKKTGEWKNPDAEQYANGVRRDLMEAATAKRIDNWLSMADGEMNPERREHLLAMAQGWSGFTGGTGKEPILSELARSAIDKGIADVRLKAVQREGQFRTDAIEGVKIAVDDFMEHPNAKTRAAMEKAMSNPYLSPTDAQAAKKYQLDYRVNTQLGILNYLLSSDPEQAKAHITTMDPAAIAKYQEQIATADGTGRKKGQSLILDRIDTTIETGGTITRDTNGTVRVERNIPRPVLRNMVSDAFASVLITKSEFNQRIDRINEVKKEPEFIQYEREDAIKAMEEISGSEIVDSAIAVQNGMVYIAIDKDKGKPMSVFASGDERVPYFGQSSRNSDGEVFDASKRKGIELDAKAVVAVLQYVSDYHRMNPQESDPLKVKSTRDIVRELLMPGPNQPVEVYNSQRFKTQTEAAKWSKQLFDLQTRHIEQQFKAIDANYGIQ